MDVFPFSPGFLCNLVRKSPQNVEKIARPLSGLRKTSRILSRLWLSWVSSVPKWAQTWHVQGHWDRQANCVSTCQSSLDIPYGWHQSRSRCDSYLARLVLPCEVEGTKWPWKILWDFQQKKKLLWGAAEFWNILLCNRHPWKPCYLQKKESRLFFLGHRSVWSFPSFSSLSDYSIRSSWNLFWSCDHSIWSTWVHGSQIRFSLRKNR